MNISNPKKKNMFNAKTSISYAEKVTFYAKKNIFKEKKFA
jgi:hypothetical protein